MATIHKFPSDLDSGAGSGKGSPMIRFTAKRIQTGASLTNMELGASLGSIWLPIPPEGISTTHPQNWGEQDQNLGQATIGKLIADYQNASKTGEGLKPGETGPPGRNYPMAGGISGFASRVADATNAGIARAMGEGGEMDKVLKGYTLNKMGVVNFDQRVAEQSIVSYTGPSYREHSFSFQLRPQSGTESVEIDRIEKFFLLNSSPRLLGSNSILRLYELPAVWEVSFHVGSDVHKGITGLSASALTGFDVKYGGEKYNVFSTSYPVQTDITLQFKELKLMDRDIYTDMYNKLTPIDAR